MADLVARLEQAVANLDSLLAYAVEHDVESEEVRLRGKREGVQLALSYAREALRQ